LKFLKYNALGSNVSNWFNLEVDVRPEIYLERIIKRFDIVHSPSNALFIKLGKG